MILTQSAFEHLMLQLGTEILAINGKPVAEILATLIPLQRTDRANEGQQVVNLQLFGADKFEPFDMYFPILFPPTHGEYDLTVADFTTKEKATIKVPAMSRKERVNLIKKRFPRFNGA